MFMPTAPTGYVEGKGRAALREPQFEPLCIPAGTDAHCLDRHLYRHGPGVNKQCCRLGGDQSQLQWLVRNLKWARPPACPDFYEVRAVLREGALVFLDFGRWGTFDLPLSEAFDNTCSYEGTLDLN